MRGCLVGQQPWALPLSGMCAKIDVTTVAVDSTAAISSKAAAFPQSLHGTSGVELPSYTSAGKAVAK